LKLTLERLQLPLAFFAMELQQQQTSPDSNLYTGYLHAISVNPDRRRIEMLLELRAKAQADDESYWNRLLATAADKEWAVQTLLAFLEQDLKLTEDSLFYYLINRFAGDLPKNLQTACYDYTRRHWIRSHWEEGPGDYGSDYWHILLQIDVERGRNEIIPYYGDKKGFYDHDIVELLNKHASPSKEVARAAKQWFSGINTAKGSKDVRFIFTIDLWILLLKSDPQGELKATIKQIDHLIAEKKAQKEKYVLSGPEERLIDAMIALNPNQAVPPLLRYVHEPILDDFTQLKIIKWLLKRRYEKTAQVIAQWISESPDEYKRGIRKHGASTAAQEWGEYGRQIMQQVDEINKTR
jgi:hypothetical protein